mgnify:CR=1 FL=1
MKQKNIERYIRENISRLCPYSTARDEFSGVADVLLDANESPYSNGFNRYPDPHQKVLKQKVAAYKGIDVRNLFLGNGSEPWLIPSMSEYPDINPPFATGAPNPGEKFHPFERDPETLVPKWALPGQKGFEHRVGGLEKTHEGVLSTDPQNHEMMVRERAGKVARIAADLPELKIRGEESGNLLVVGWGGTYGHIASAVHDLQEAGEKVSYTHFDYINPLPPNTEKVLSAFSKILVCELNSGQFADYLRARFPDLNFIKFNKIQGQPFLVDEVKNAILKEI